MITLITGLPGNGKTLYALTWLRDKAIKENRQVYYNGVADLRIPGWIELVNPEKWAECPTGSIILIDEAQRIFRPRMHGKEVPGYVAALETHRHLGVDLVFVTQHPMLIESNVRRLTGQHFHVIRKFGTQWATIHEWNKCKETCDKNRDDSTRLEFKYPPDIFDLYKSAELHTHKRRIPFKVLALFSMPVIFIGLAYLAYTRLAPDQVAERNKPAGQAEPSAGVPAVNQRVGAGKLTQADYLEAQTPRVAGLAYTAPVFDQATTPTEAPYPAACLVMRGECRCYSQQATRLEMPAALCEQIVAKGFFVAWRQPVQQQSQARPGEQGGGPGGALAPAQAPALRQSQRP